MGPVDIIEVDESEYVRTKYVTEYIEREFAPRTWKDLIVEDVILPIARETMEKPLDVGMQLKKLLIE